MLTIGDYAVITGTHDMDEDTFAPLVQDAEAQLHQFTRMRKAREALAEAQNAVMTRRDDESMGVYGLALRELIAVVFGEEQTDKLLAFYEGRPDSLLDDIMPYILDRIAPKVARASRKRARQLRRGKV